jgi:hypothetical protein
VTKKRAARKGSSPTKAFVDAVQGAVGTMLASFGFVRAERSFDGTLASCVYGKGTAYIEFTMNIHPLDRPDSCEVILGDGQREWPERDWNAIRLRLLGGRLAHPPVSDYLLDSFPDIHALVARMQADLERVGDEFLRGDLDAFKRVRAEVNRKREPYKIHRPLGDGTYRTEVDPRSLALKNRFS